MKESTAAGLDGLKGHRSVGGMRASIYNAFPEDGIDALVVVHAGVREEERLDQRRDRDRHQDSGGRLEAAPAAAAAPRRRRRRGALARRGGAGFAFGGRVLAPRRRALR